MYERHLNLARTSCYEVGKCDCIHETRSRTDYRYILYCIVSEISYFELFLLEDIIKLVKINEDVKCQVNTSKFTSHKYNPA